jgi:nitrogen regulatory protein PII
MLMQKRLHCKNATEKKTIMADEEKLSESVKSIENQQQKSNIDTGDVFYDSLCDAVRLQDDRIKKEKMPREQVQLKSSRQNFKPMQFYRIVP